VDVRQLVATVWGVGSGWLPSRPLLEPAHLESELDEVRRL